MEGKPTTIRLSEEILDRVDRLIPAIQADPTTAWANLNRSSVLRLAIIKGLESLARQYRPKGGRR